MSASLVMGWRPPSARTGAFQFDSMYVSVKTQIEIKPSLLSISDYIQASGHLIVDGGNGRILLEFFYIFASELIQMSGGKFQP